MSDVIRIPKWFWGLLIVAAGGAGHLTVMAHENRQRIKATEENDIRLESALEKVATLTTDTREEQLRRSNSTDIVDDLKSELSLLRAVLEQLREDVIVLKTQRSSPSSGGP